MLTKLRLAIPVCGVATALLSATTALYSCVSAAGLDPIADGGVTTEDANNAPMRTDGGTPDAPIEVADAAPDSPNVLKCPLPNLLSNGDFENGTVNWMGSSETTQLVSTTTSHSGRTAAKFCTTAGGNYFDLQQSDLGIAANTSVQLRMWVRNADPLAPKLAGFYVAALDGAYKPTTIASGVPTDANWRCLEGAYQGEIQRFLISGQHVPQDGGAETCVIVDDVELVKVQGGGVPPACRCPTE
jgi:hypothetical protein